MPIPSRQPIRILLIDDHALVRTALHMLIESGPGLHIVGEAANRSEALAIAVREQPDIVLLDLDLGGSSGLDFLPELLAAASQTRVLVLTSVCDPELHRRAVCLGAKGVVLKEKTAEVLFKAIEKVYAGEVWLERSMIAAVLDELNGTKQVGSEKAKIATLTPRECEVISLIGQGLRNKKIAQSLFISETTVRHHLTSIFDKLGVSERLELVIYAYRHDLAKIPS